MFEQISTISTISMIPSPDECSPKYPSPYIYTHPPLNCYSHTQVRGIRPLNEARMIEIRIARSMFYSIHGPRNQFIQIDMTFNFIFCQGLPGTCLYKSNTKR